MRSRARTRALGLVLALIASLAVVVQGQTSAAALSGSQFQAGNIISDSVFYDSTALTAGGVQSFLNAKYQGCDSGYVCVRDYRTKTTSHPAESGLCSAYTGRSSETAAAIIANVGRACGINPQVLIVLLQKESGLITSTSPDYQTAAGFGCPDSTGCASQYFGFFNQVYLAARQFRLYRLNPNDYGYVAGQTNYILYNPDTSCGRGAVYIQNQATAGLYDYTPYQPNKAALANLSGTGDSCSTYGNRNFWVFFNSWFTVPSAPYDAGGLLATKADGTLWYYRNTGSAATPFPTGVQIGLSGWQGFTVVDTGDVNRDGLADVIARKADGSLWLYLNNGTSLPYGSAQEIGVSGWNAFSSLVVADVDGDGRADLVAARPDGSLWLYRNDGNAAHPFAGSTRIGSGWQVYRTLILADVTGDGLADLLGIRPDGSLWLYRGNGSAHPFGGSTEIGSGGWQSFRSVVASDVDVDGRADLLATTGAGNLVRYHNGGGGRPFAAGVTIGHGGWQAFTRLASSQVPVPRQGVTSDVVAARSDGSLWSFANDSPPAPFPTATRIGSGWNAFDLLTTGDVTGDGKADLVARRPDGSLWLYRGSGSASHPYSTGARIGATGWGVYPRMVLADVTGDGKADLLVTGADGSLWMYRNTGSATRPFTTRLRLGVGGWGSLRSLTAADVTGDGRIDLLVTTSAGVMEVFANTGSAGRPYAVAHRIGSGWQDVTSLRPLAPAVPEAGAPADLVATAADGSLWFYRNSGNRYHPYGAGARIGAEGWNGLTPLLSADVDGDGRADLLGRTSSGALLLYRGAGAGPLSPGRRVGTSGWAGFALMAAGDVNGDGRADLVLTKSSGTLWYYPNTGDPSRPYAGGTVIGASGWAGFRTLAVGDVTGDGRADLVLTKADGSLWIYRNTGNATHPYASGFMLSRTGWQAFPRVLLGDVNGDGLADIVAVRSNGSLWLFPNQHSPTHTFAPKSEIGAGGWASLTHLIAADIDHDGLADLVATRSDGTMIYYVNSGVTARPYTSGVRLPLTGWQSFGALAA